VSYTIIVDDQLIIKYVETEINDSAYL